VSAGTVDAWTGRKLPFDSAAASQNLSELV
jgi:hypothetical protein